MKYKTKYIVKLSLKEAEALKICLGKQSDSDRSGWGLSQKEINRMHNLYGFLPFRGDRES